MRRITHEDLLADALGVREMIALVERFLAGTASRQELISWAHSTHPRGQQGTFRHSGPAEDLHSCLYDLDAKLPGSQQWLVRSCDLVAQLHRVRIGGIRVHDEPIAFIKLSPAELARRLGVDTTRTLVPGLGWRDSLWFGSLATGISFYGMGKLEGERPPHGTCVWGFQNLPSAAERAFVLVELFDTLHVDAEDAADLWVTPTQHWDIRRLDDNGHTFLVASFTGYAKACDHLTQFESLHHKQSYWIEPRCQSDQPGV